MKSIIANNPYIIVADEDITLSSLTETIVPVIPKRLEQAAVDNYVMSGSLASISEEKAEGQRIYALNEEACWNIITATDESEQTIYPYHAFIQATKDNMPKTLQIRLVTEDDATGIEDVEIIEEKMDNIIYDLQGRRVFEPQNGNLYIINGNKVLFK